MNEKEVNKLEALSPTEQKVYSEIYSKRVINTEDVREILGEGHRSVDYITNLRQKGYLDKIRRGVYAVVPPNLVGSDFKPDKFLVAGKLKGDYYPFLSLRNGTAWGGSVHLQYSMDNNQQTLG